MNKYFENLQQKIMLYTLALILFGTIYYYFNLNLQNEVNKAQQQAIIMQQKTLISFKALQNRFLNKKKKYFKLLNSKIKEDYKYLTIKLKTTPKLNVDEKKFFNILNFLVKDSTNKDLDFSFKLNKEKNKFLVYTINIEGKANNIYNLYFFIKDFESKNIIKSIPKFHYDIINSKKVDLSFKIWSLK